MQSLQRMIQTIAGQIKGLTPTAKMLLGSLMVILVMSLFLVSLYAGRREMVPLGLSADVTAESRGRATDYLTSSSIPFEVSGTDVMVPADRKLSILAQLTEMQVIGGEQINFDRLMSDDSPFRTRDQNRQRYLVAKMNVLGRMISQMSGIERATVVLDVPEGGIALGSSHIAPSASVTVLPRSSELGQTQVDAIARLVAGSHAGLKPQNVAIIDARTGRALQARTDDAIGAGKYMEVKLDAERHVRSTIENALRYIPGVVVAVNAQVDTKQVVQQTSKYDEPKVGETESISHVISSSNAGSGAPAGVQPNTGASIAPPGGGRGGTQLSDERTQTSGIPFVGTATTQTKDTKGYALQINATVGVPKSYFVRLFQDQQGDASKQPEAAELDALVQRESERIKSMISPLIDTQAMEGAVAGTLAVSMVPDFSTLLAGEGFGGALVSSGSGGGGGGSGGEGILNEGLIKYVTLGALAALSLFMMFMVVRKASSREELPTASELVGIPPALAAAESDLVGEADEASPALEGLELNDDAIRRQQMLDQITEMVTSTPDDAANLLRRWMKTEV